MESNEKRINTGNDSTVFMPLNISYPIKKSGEKKLLMFIVCTVIFVLLLIIIAKVRSDFFFSSFIASPIFLILAIAASIYTYVILLMLLVFREPQQMKLYKELLMHEDGTISDLWEIHSMTNDICAYFNNTSKIFVKLEKGFTISRVPEHEKHHREAFKLFIRDISSRGYDIEYLNYHISDANTTPLESNYQVYVNNNKNEKLRKFGAELLREYRTLDNIGSSTVEYIVVTAKTSEATAYLRSNVENACSYLEDSLYTDVKICDEQDMVEMLQVLHKVSGINLQELMDVNVSNISQQFVKIIKVIGADVSVEEAITQDDEDDFDEEEMERYIEELENEIKTKNNNQDTHDNRNLVKKGISKSNSHKQINDEEIEEQLNYNSRKRHEEAAYVTPVDDDIDINDSCTEDEKECNLINESICVDSFKSDNTNDGVSEKSSIDDDGEDDDPFAELFEEEDDDDPFAELFNEVDKDLCSIESKNDIVADIDTSNSNKSEDCDDDDDEDPFEELFKDI